MVRDNYIYLVWQDPKSRSKYVVGELKKDKGYSFFYTEEYREARQIGWEMLKPFPEEKVYTSKVVFPIFASRLPDSRRRDINTILSEYGLEKYDEYELLRKTGARLPIDSYEFIDPIFPDEEVIERVFYISGVRHTLPCEGESCVQGNIVKVGDNLVLQMEPGNKYDDNAVFIQTESGNRLGYIPRYYSKQVSRRLQLNISYDCKVKKADFNNNCRECILVRLQMPKMK